MNNRENKVGVRSINKILLFFLVTIGIATMLGSFSTSRRPAQGPSLMEYRQWSTADLKRERASLKRDVDFFNKGLKTGAVIDYRKTEQERDDLEERIGNIDRLLREREMLTCFSRDTLVLTEEGPVAIQNVHAGDKVLTSDEAGAVSYRKVVKTTADINNHYYRINGEIEVTGYHRFFTNEGWKRVRDIQPGERIMTSQGDFKTVSTIEKFNVDLDVFNLQVEEHHNFFVSADGRTGYLAHNTGGGGGDGSGGGK